MHLQVAIVFVVLIGSVILFITEVLPIDVVSLLILLALGLTRVLTPDEALSGFSDEAVITIAGFFVISAALFSTGVVEAIGRHLYVLSGNSKARLLIVIMVVSAAIASFMSNVVTAAILMPAVIGISRRMKEPPSRFLMPLAFGAILGGKCTLVGSPTNLAVSGLLSKLSAQHPISNQLFPGSLQPLGVFELTPLGITLVISGVIYMLVLGMRLLPKHDNADFNERDQAKEYVTEVVVLPNSRLTSKTLGETDFRGRYDLQILGIVRGGEQQLPHRDAILSAGDVLLVKGGLEQILGIKDDEGLDIKSHGAQNFGSDGKTKLAIVEAILSPNSRFVGRSLKQLRFSSRYGADVLAIYRHNRTLHEKLSGLRLEFGDVLVIQGVEERIDQLREDPNFLTLDDVEHKPLIKRKATWAVAIVTLAAIAAGFKLAPVSLIALSAAAAMLISRCITIGEAYNRIEWSAIVLIAATIPLGTAMEKTGAAKILADYVTTYFGFGGPMLVLAGFFVFTLLLTQPMSNAATAILLTPIAIDVAESLRVNPRTFAIAIAIAASCSFPTPLEPVTAIVYGPGKYRFSDYVRVGGGLTLIVMIITLLLAPILWPLHNP